MNEHDQFDYWLKNEHILSAQERTLLHEIGRDDEAIKEHFHSHLSFGTAGMRGILGLGTNRMNIYTIRRAAQGYADYIIDIDGKKAGVAIAYDSRIGSREFAKETALVLAANGIRVYLYESLRSVPQLSYTILKLKCAGGIVITASHNPPEYNGFKVYGCDGGQMAPEPAAKVTAFIEAYEDYLNIEKTTEKDALESGLLHYIGADLDTLYYEDVLSLLEEPYPLQDAEKLNIVYTPLFGSGHKPIMHLLSALGANLHVVEAQAEPNGNFPGISAPNPENRDAFLMSIAEADAVKADLIFATDPDADRLGVAVRKQDGSFKILSGNQIGCLLMDYLLSTREIHPDTFVVKSLVSSSMADAIAAVYGVTLKTVPTGFKFVAEEIANSLETGIGRFLFGFEESYGSLASTFVRDKDANMAAVLLAQAALAHQREGRTLYDALSLLEEKYGYFAECVLSITLSGLDGIEKISSAMQSLRLNTPKEIAGLKVVGTVDYLTSIKIAFAENKRTCIDFPKGDIYGLLLEKGYILFRPSGTEPKLKAYISFQAENRDDAKHMKRQISQAAKALLEERTA